jgi:hypothetical protein
MKGLHYSGRHGEQIYTEHSEKAWEFLKQEMQNDNRCTFEEAVRDFGVECLSGTFEYGPDCHLYMDDGGEIHTFEFTEVP